MKNKVTHYQLFGIVFFLTHGFLISGMFPTLFSLSKTGSLFAIVLGTLLGCLFLLLLEQVRKRDVLTILDSYFPKVLSFFFKIVLFLSFSFLAGFLLFEHTNYTIDNLLIGSSPIVISLIFLILVFYIASQKIEVLAKFQEVLFFLFCLFFLLLIVGLTPLANPDLLKPMIGERLWEGTLFYFLATTIPMSLLLFLPKQQILSQKNQTKYVIVSYLIGNLFVLLLSILILSILGPDLAVIYRYPETVILKKISYFSFVERMEGSLSILYLLDLTVFLSLTIHVARNCLRSILSKKHFLLDLFQGILILFLSFHLTKNRTNLFLYFGGFFLSFILLLFLVQRFSKKKEKILET